LSRKRLSTPIRARAAWLSLAIGCAAAGQYVFSKDVDNDLPLRWIALHLDRVFRNPESALLAISLLLLGGLAFTVAWRDSTPFPPRPLDVQNSAASERFVFDRICIVVALVAILLLFFLLGQLGAGNYQRPYLALFFLILILLSFAAWRQDSRRGIRVNLKVKTWEAALVVAIMVGYALLNGRDLDNWYYSAIGDEYAFFGLAKDIAQGFDANMFSAEQGVYRQHVVASSGYQAIFLKLFGLTNFNWKLSGLISILLAFPFFYLLVKEVLDRYVAIVATVLLASSHYLFAYVHVGYNNIQAIFPTVAALSCFLIGVRRGSFLMMFLAGVFAGSGFYTFFSSRATIVVMAIWFLTLAGWNRRWGTILCVSLGFIATVAPLFATSKLYVIEEMMRQSVVSYNDSVVGSSRLERLLENLPRTIFAFNYNPNHQHFVSGSLADVITAPLFVIGCVFTLIHLKDWRFRFLAVWFISALVASGLFSPYPQVSISRLFYLVPIVVILAGVALAGVVRGIESMVPTLAWPPFSGAAAIVVLGIILVLNVHRFWSVTPSTVPTTQESVAVSVFLASPCRQGTGNYAVGPGANSLLKPALETYKLGEAMPILLRPDETEQLSSLKREDVRCVVVTGSRQEQERITDLLLEALPGMRDYQKSDLSGRTMIRWLTTSRP
jgi:4-amino-4-deoxy-L-arabinose transferase-like glycosyltransferase